MLNVGFGSWDRTSRILAVDVSDCENELLWVEIDVLLSRSTFQRIVCWPTPKASSVRLHGNDLPLPSQPLSLAQLLGRSPDGELLLTRLNRGVKVWTKVPEHRWPIDGEHVHANMIVGWCLQENDRSQASGSFRDVVPWWRRYVRALGSVLS